MTIKERNLMRRINRKLPEFHKIKKNRKLQSSLGRFSLIDTYQNWCKDPDVDLLHMGSKLGVCSATDIIV